MDDYLVRVKKIQAEAMANLEREWAEAEARAKRDADSLRVERRMFLMTMVNARLERKLSQHALAAKLGTSQPTISRIEAGHGNPGLQTLLKIAKVCGANLVLEYKE